MPNTSCPDKLIISMKLTVVTLLFTVLSLLSNGVSQTSRTYTVTDLGTLGGSRSVGVAINASGQITGWSDTDGTIDHPHGFVYTPGTYTLVDIGDLGGNYSTGHGINRSGQVTGWSMTADGAYHAILYTPGNNPLMLDLRPVGFGSSNGLSINDLGWVTGSMDIGNGVYHAFLYKPGSNGLVDLTPDAINGQGRGINNSGSITGFAGPTQTVHAFLYTDVLADLGVLANGTYSQGNAINEAGEMTGSGDGAGVQHAFVYRNGQLVDLDPTGPFREGVGINSCGNVVGAYLSNAGISAYYYDAELGVVDLNTLIPADSGWVLSAATAINDRGQITGYGYHNNAEHAFLLDPGSGSFECAGTMHVPRTNHAASLLSGGDKVLITGGSDGTGSLNSTEIYELSTRSFRFTGKLTHPRYSHTATLLDNGQVLVAGGYDTHTATFVAEAEIYDPITQAFDVTHSPMNTGRQNHTATLLSSGKVLIAGGITGSLPLSGAELYDPSQRTFAPTSAAMSFPRYGHAAVRLRDGRVLITGGCGAGLPDCTNTAEIYDPATDTFRLTAYPMQQARAWHTATLLANGMVLVVGGIVGNLQQSAELYDPAADVFLGTTGQMVGMNSYYHASTILFDGTVLTAGGTWSDPAGTDRAQLYSGTTYAFYPAAGTMSSPRIHHTATLLGNGQVLLAGGDLNGKVLASADLYNGPDSITGTLATNGTPTTFPFGNGIVVNIEMPAKVNPKPSPTLTVFSKQIDPVSAAAKLAVPVIPGGAVITAAISAVSGLGGDGFLFHIDCTDANGNACDSTALSPATVTADDSYTIKITWDGPAGSNPGLLRQENSDTPWENVLLSYSPTAPNGGSDPAVVGKTKTLSGDWMIVYNLDPTSPASINIDSPSAGATYYVNQDVNASYTCSNSVACIGDVASGAAIDTTSASTKTFTVLATVDGAHSTAVKTITYNVAVATVTVVVNASKILNAPNPSLAPPAASSITYSGFLPGDDSSGLSGTLTCTTTALQASPVGKYPITCSGLSSSKYDIKYVAGTLTVAYAGSGSCAGDAGHSILQPINVDGSSVWKQGRTIPAKFRVCDANGVSIGTPGVVSNVRLAKIVSGTVGNVDEADSFATVDWMFRWDQGEQLWIYNMRTTNQSAGYTYLYEVTLNDGSVIDFQYGLR